MTLAQCTASLSLCDPSSSHNCSGRGSTLQPRTYTTIQDRQNSFKRHPDIINLRISPSDLAEEGFYFDGTRIVCVGCTVVLPSFNSWNKGEKLRDVHRRIQPREKRSRCPYLGDNLDQSSTREDDDDDDGEDEVDFGNTSNTTRSRPLETDDMPLSVSAGHSPNGTLSQTLSNDRSTVTKTSIVKQKLREENERLRIICHKCKVEKIQTLFLPCRHLVTCEKCADTLDNCLLCNGTILGTVRTYLG